LDKDFFNFERDIYTCLIFNPPVQSIVTQSLIDKPILDLLNEPIEKFKKIGDILLCGDFNARVGNNNDFISNDDNQFNPSYLNYTGDSANTRTTQDKVIDHRGTELLDLCIGHSLRILNGQLAGDSMGRYTCFTPNGSSTVDYSIV